MDTLVSYLLRSMLISGLLLAYYYAALRNRKIHSFNRVFLLMALAAAALLPLVRLPWLHWHSAEAPVLFVAGAGMHPVKSGGVSFSVITLLAGACISLALLGILSWQIIGVLRLRRGAQRVRFDGAYLIEVKDRRAPFSFLRNLFWQRGADLTDPVNRQILDHELAHIHGKHTYDSLFANLLTALFWMNPFYWVIRKELVLVHEFIADDASIGTGDTASFAAMLLQAYDEGHYLDPSHRFFHSPIKRRLIMISKSSGPARYRKWLALPVLLAVMALSCSKEQANPPAKTQNVTAIKTLNLRSVKLKLLIKDSLDQAISRQFKSLVFVSGKHPGNDSVTIRFNTAADKQELEKVFRISSEGAANQDQISVMGQNPPPPPPPQPEKRN